MDIAGVDVEIDVIRELPELEDLEVNPSTEDQSFNSSKYGFKNVIIKGIKGDKLELNPSLEQQNVKGVFTEVNINPIQTKKLNATPTTQEQVISGLFDEVTVNAIEGQELNLNPSEEQQNYEGVFLGVNINPIQVEEITTDLDFSSSNAIEITAQEGAYIKKATINKDANLSPENIKSGVTIAGVSGDVADTSDADATSDDIVAGKTAYVANEKIAGTYIPLDTSDATATAEDIAKDKTAYVNGEKVVGTATGGNSDLDVKIDLASYAGTTNFLNVTAKTLIKKADFTNVDLSNATKLSGFFNGCTGIVEVLGVNASTITHLSNFCCGCISLQKVEINNTENVKAWNNTFADSTTIVDLPEFDCSSATNVSGIVTGCKALTNIGGFKNLGKAYMTTANNSIHTLDLSSCTLLTHESLMNVINGLYDLNLTYNVANGGTLYRQSLVLGSTNLPKLTADEIAIATNKGWNVS